MNALVYSSSLVAAFLGGVLALFAPCCVISLMPTFVGAALRQGRLRLPVTTLLFAAGVAVVLLPVVLGVGALGQVLAAYHQPVYLVVGLFLAFLGASALLGRGWALPMPTLRLAADPSRPGGTFVLGMVSGVVSSCCAPVLAGVIAMSALAASLAGALGLGLAYVFGMVFPLFLAALFWDRLHLGQRAGPRPRRHIRLGSRTIPWTDAAAGVVFLVMAGLALDLAVTGQSTLTPGLLLVWSRWGSGLAADLAAALQRVPAYGQALMLLGLASLVGAAVYAAWRQGPAGK